LLFPIFTIILPNVTASEKFFKNAVKEGLLSKIRKKRLTEEFLILLNEKKPFKVIERMDNLGILTGILAKFCLSKELIQRFKQVENRILIWNEIFPKESITKSTIYLYYLINLSSMEIKNITKKIDLSNKNIKKLEQINDKKDEIISILTEQVIWPSRIYCYLKDINTELLFIIFLEYYNNKLIIKRIKNYLNKYKYENNYINGNDLKKIGMRPNPIYAKILKLVLYLQLNGVLKTFKLLSTFSSFKLLILI